MSSKAGELVITCWALMYWVSYFVIWEKNEKEMDKARAFCNSQQLYKILNCIHLRLCMSISQTPRVSGSSQVCGVLVILGNTIFWVSRTWPVCHESYVDLTILFELFVKHQAPDRVIWSDKVIIGHLNVFMQGICIPNMTSVPYVQAVPKQGSDHSSLEHRNDPSHSEIWKKSKCFTIKQAGVWDRNLDKAVCASFYFRSFCHQQVYTGSNIIQVLNIVHVLAASQEKDTQTAVRLC